MKKLFEKIVVSVGTGKLTQQPQYAEKLLPEIKKELSAITGQKPSPRPAKKSIASFKTRTGDIIGLKVTLRGTRMNDFLSRLIHVALPRVKDFRGIPLHAIDARGNLNIGLRDQFVFPEINADQSKVNFGLQVTFVPAAGKEKDKIIDFYRSAGVPLRKL